MHWDTVENLHMATQQGSEAANDTHTVQIGQSPPQLKILLESIQDGLIVLDANWLCTYANSTAAAFLKSTPDELVGKTIWEAFPESQHPHFHKELTFAAEQQTFVRFEAHYASLQRWYECRAYPTDGGLTLFLADITGRKRTEEALKRSRTVLMQAGKMANLGVWSIEFTDAFGELNKNSLQWCDQVYRIFGYEPGSVKVTIDLFFQHVHPEDRQRIIDAIAQALADRQPYEIEHRVLRPDGTERIVLAHAEIEFDAQGRPLRMVGAVQDITERRLAEKALQASEFRYRRLFEADQVAVYITRPDGTFLDCNDAMVKLLGYDSREEVLHRRSSDFYVDSAFRDDAVQTLLKTGVYPAKEGLVWRKDGSIAHALGWAVLLRDETTGEPYIQGLAVDITERRRAEEAVRESEQRFRAVLENSLDVAYRRDLRKNRYDYISPVVEKIMGFSPQEMSELPLEQVLDRIHPEDTQRVRRELAQAMARGEGGLEYRWRCKDGQYRWLADYLVVEKDETGRPVYLTGVVRDTTGRKEMEAELRQWNDHLSEQVRSRTSQLTNTVSHLREEITRRVQAETELRKSSQMLESFFEHTISPLAFMDRDFNFIRVNEAYARADGKTPEYFVGKNHFTLYPDEENRAIFGQVVRTKQPYRAYAKPLAYPKDPQRLTYWNWQLTPLMNEANEVQSLVLNLENVTQQQRAYQELEQRTRQLQHLAMELSQAEDRERKRLAELLHDDLQQLLAAAKFQLGLLGSRLKNEKTVQEMTGEVKQLLVEAIGKSRSLSHELSPPVLGQSDLCEIFEWVVEQVKAKHGLTVYLDYLEAIHVGSEPLKAFLYRTVQEMLFNVVKHAKVKEAQLRLRRANGHLWLCVSDKGRGFDPQELGKTVGFGLLSVRERIELLGGRMRIRSAPGKGSIFVISVPDPGPGEPEIEQLEGIGEAVLPPPAVRKKRAKRTGDKRVRVLLADDHRVMREGLAAMLDEEHDMEVVGQAGNGREAVDLAYQLAPDVVVMDVAMPVMAGDEATRQIKKHLPNTRVIALSMFEDSHMSRRMHKAGAETYLSKTGPSEDLLAAIRSSG